MKRGFTLVELSIVLVIIGLLIGGILVAQSMINTAKIQNFVRQINQFDTAVSNFKTKYNGLPGDTPAMGCPDNVSCPVCNDGYVSNSQAYLDPSYFYCETANFWPNLQQSGFAAPNGAIYSKTITGNFKVQGTTINSPQLLLGSNTGVWSTSDEPLNDGVFNNFYLIADFSLVIDSNTHENVHHSSVSAADAQAVDNKIDDGSPIYTVSTNMLGVSNSGSDNCRNGSNYNSADPNAVCTLEIRMLGTTGNKE